MTQAHVLPNASGPGAAVVTERLREMGLGFLYWLAFVLVLEPDNLLRSAHVGAPINWVEEISRLTAAGALGAVATPFLVAAVRRWPVELDAWPRRLAIQAAIAVVSALGLV